MNNLLVNMELEIIHKMKRGAYKDALVVIHSAIDWVLYVMMMPLDSAEMQYLMEQKDICYQALRTQSDG